MPSSAMKVPLGTKFMKQFDVGLFEGTVESYNQTLALYRIEYSDGDAEDMPLWDLRIHLRTTVQNEAMSDLGPNGESTQHCCAAP